MKKKVKKIKRIDYVCQGLNNKIRTNSDSKKRRVERTFEALIDDCKDNIEEKKEAAIQQLNLLSNCTTTEQMSSAIQKYIDNMRDVDEYETIKKHLETAKELMDEEIEIEDTEE